MWIERNGRTWRIREQAGGRKFVVASGYATKTAARQAMTVLEADKLRGEALIHGGTKMTLAELVGVWWPAHQVKLRPGAVKSEGGRLRNHILPLLGDYELGDIEPMVVKAWVAQLLSGDEELGRKPLAPKTIRNIHGVLYAVLDEAVSQRLIRANPCQRTGLPKVPHKEQRFLTEPEIGRLVAAFPAWAQPPVILLAATGLRWSEMCGLKVKRVDVLARTVRVEEALHELTPGAPLVTTEPKSRGSRRTVTVPREVAEVLAARVAGRGREAYVFTGPDGGPLRYKAFWRLWVDCAYEAGLAGLRIHDLRHTHAAHLIAGKVPLTGVQRRLGHGSITMTSDLYGHLLPQVDTEIVAATETSLAMIDFRGILGGPGEKEPGKTGVNGGERAGQAASHAV